jgi:ABC-type glycerol-3-phosphate transport system substrate-binding protein
MGFSSFHADPDHYKFGQIVITNFADALNGSKSVEDAMAAAQVQAEALAERIQ